MRIHPEKVLFVFLFFWNFSAFTQQISFERYYNNLNSYHGSSVQQTFDGGYVITGVHSVTTFNNNLVLFKTDSVGNLLWIKSYGGPNNDGGQCVKQTLDSGFVIVGTKDYNSTSDSKIWLLRTDKNGDTLWSKSIIAGLGANVGYYVEQTTDTGFIICGYTSAVGAGSYDVFIVKSDLNGDTVWTKTFGSQYADAAYCIKQTIDGGYIVTGYYGTSLPFNSDVYVIKTNAIGDSLWTRKYGGCRSDVAHSVEETSDGGYVLGGMTSSFSDTIFWNMYLIKTNANGDTLWTKDYGLPGSENIYSVRQTSDNGFMLFGNINGASIVKTNSVGDTLWTKSYNGIAWFGDLTADGGCIITGDFGQFGNSIYLLKTDSSGYAITGFGEPAGDVMGGFSVYPNPFSDYATLVISAGYLQDKPLLRIFDIAGKIVLEQIITNERTALQRGNLSPGIFICHLTSKNGILASGKIILTD